MWCGVRIVVLITVKGRRAKQHWGLLLVVPRVEKSEANAFC